jgi:hypothetical protein
MTLLQSLLAAFALNARGSVLSSTRVASGSSICILVSGPSDCALELTLSVCTLASNRCHCCTLSYLTIEHRMETHIHREMGPSPPRPMDMVPKDSTIACYFVRKWRVRGGDVVVVGEINLFVAKPQSKFIP